MELLLPGGRNRWGGGGGGGRGQPPDQYFGPADSCANNNDCIPLQLSFKWPESLALTNILDLLILVPIIMIVYHYNYLSNGQSH